MSHTQVSEWHKRLSEEWEETDDDEYLGRLRISKTNENIKKVIKIVWSHWRLSIRMIKYIVNIDKEIFRQIS